MDEERPLCKCHGEPMRRSGTRYGKIRYKCRVTSLELNKEWRKNNPEYAKSERYKEKSKEWYKNNSERRKEKSKEWRKNNPERVKKNKELWTKKNPGYNTEKSRRRREKNPEYDKEAYRRKNIKNFTTQQIKLFYGEKVWKMVMLGSHASTGEAEREVVVRKLIKFGIDERVARAWM